MPKKKIVPIPEGLLPFRDWEVSESGQESSSVDLVHRTMRVPLGADEGSSVRRLLEMGRLKWSPPKHALRNALHPEATEGIREAAESARLHSLLVNNGLMDRSQRINSDLMLIHRAVQASMDSRFPLTEAATLLASCHATGDAAVVEAALDEAFTHHPNPTKRMMWESAKSMVRRGIRQAERLSPRFLKYSTVIARDLCAIRRMEEQREDAEICANSDLRDDEGDVVDAEEIMDDPSYQSVYVPGESEWGRLMVRTAPLARPLRSELRRRSKMSMEYGTYVRSPQRYCTDKRIFRSRGKKQQGGTVLIDVSGSMDLSLRDVLEILEAMPAAKIAVYSGLNDEGVLKIIAKDGRRADGHDLTNGEEMYGNIVDGPALEWLCKEQSPRFWVSDGYVTGVGETMTRGLLEDVVSLLRRGNIQRIPSVSMVADVAEKLKAARR